ncbi:hypothetical protein KC356_g6742 [Hortaea werneckii]|nr:hypothetical protein KC356_g6742 [Hortaea werneckii]
MVSTKSVNKPTFEQPYSGFPTTILYRDSYLLVECPECGGNARSDPPNHFYEQPYCFGSHLRKVHNIGDGTATYLFENYWQDFQVLSGSDLSDLNSGDFKLPRKPVVKKHGDHAQEVKSKNTSIVLEKYPTVAQKPDGTYVELSCCFCDGGNSLIRRGGRGARGEPPLIYARGVRGLWTHIGLAHKAQAGRSSKGLHWLLEHCGKPISEERFQQLKKDHTGELIPKKEMFVTEHKHHFRTVQELDVSERQTSPNYKKNAIVAEPTIQQHRPKKNGTEKTAQGTQHGENDSSIIEASLTRTIGAHDPCAEYERPVSEMTEAERTFGKANRYWPYGPRYLFDSFLVQSPRSSAGAEDSNTSVARQRWQRAIRRVIRLAKLKSISEPLPPPFGDLLTRNPAITWHPWRQYNPDAPTPQPFRYVPGQPFKPQTYEVLGRRWDGELVTLDHFQKGANKSQEKTSTNDQRTAEEEITGEAAAAEAMAENMRQQSVEGEVEGPSDEEAAEGQEEAERDGGRESHQPVHGTRDYFAVQEDLPRTRASPKKTEKGRVAEEQRKKG